MLPQIEYSWIFNKEFYMDWQIIFNLVAGALLASLGWFASQVWNSMETVKKEIQVLTVLVHSEFIKKSEFESFRKELLDFMYRIEDKMDSHIKVTHQ